MSLYRPLTTYDSEGNFVGYVIRKGGLPKLQSINIYVEGEEEQLRQQLSTLNQGAAITENFPDARDPDVLALTENPNWEPIEYVQAEVVDEDASNFIYVGDPEEAVVDQELSTLVFKTITVPKEPSAVMARVRKAQEIVARQRAGV